MMVPRSLQAALLLYLQMLLISPQYVHCQQSLTTAVGVYSGQPDSCGYGVISPSLFPDGHLATLSSSSPSLAGLPQSGCGACLQITCNDSSPVNCAATGPITVRIEQLSPVANGYIKLVLLNVAGSNGISSVAIAPTGTQNYVQLKNTYGAVWEGSIPTAPPLDLQISSSGQQLVLSNLVTAATAPGDVQSTVQFGPAASLGSGGLPSPAAAATASFAASPPAAVSPAMTPANTTSASPAPFPEALPSPKPPTPTPTPSPTPSLSPSPSPAASSEASPSPISKGLQYNLNGTNQGITMFAPINDAFSEPLLAGISGLDNAQTILDLTGHIPDIISDLLGYSVVPQHLQANQLLAGDTFNTTNVIKTGSGVNGIPAYIPVGIKTTTDMTQVVGVGSIANIVQPNIQACGSIIHLVSNALMPFNVRTFNLQTQMPYSPANEALSSPSPSTAVAG
ncbi:hypothetical protein WJX77_011178 [Trebouxia sp. C0004]